MNEVAVLCAKKENKIEELLKELETKKYNWYPTQQFGTYQDSLETFNRSMDARNSKRDARKNEYKGVLPQQDDIVNIQTTSNLTHAQLILGVLEEGLNLSFSDVRKAEDYAKKSIREKKFVIKV